MKNFIFKSAISLLLVLWAASAQAWTNGQDVKYVFNQSTSTGLRLMRPGALALDTINNKLYVADVGNDRVLRYAWPITSNQPAAEVVFGQPDFNTGTRYGAPTQNNFIGTIGLAVDAEGRLWVSSNGRVLWFDNAHLTSGNQPPADGVLGPSDFTAWNTNMSGPRAMAPAGLAIDMNGTLWVADYEDERVLRFDNAAEKENGADADGVLGQRDFESTDRTTARNRMHEPLGLAVFGSTLFVGEWENKRVLRFDNAAAKTDGADADGVLGHDNFTTTAKDAGASQNQMQTAGNVLVDGSGRLYAGDSVPAYSRVMIFEHAKEKANGANADNLLGQANFNATLAGATPRNFAGSNTTAFTPLVTLGMAMDSRTSTLAVSDTLNGRILIFETSIAGPEINVKTGLTYLPSGDIVPIRDTWERTFTIENPGDTPLTLSGTPAVTISGADADQFSIVSQPAATIASTGSSSFTVRMRPTSLGTKAATLTIASDDADEGSFTIVLGAEATSLTPPAGGGSGGSGGGGSCFISTMR